ncbi:MAG TPA: 4-amino-4-deoxychorismate lyase, partial [Caulobacteraceae bacterium]|nr:4-amino-4-deoxychorismate lyase [Caulobacteraceae bacterium]
RAAAASLGVQVLDMREGPAALERADAVFLTSSLAGVRPAHLLGGPHGPHPLVEALSNAVEAHA